MGLKVTLHGGAEIDLDSVFPLVLDDLIFLEEQEIITPGATVDTTSLKKIKVLLLFVARKARPETTDDEVGKLSVKEMREFAENVGKMMASEETRLSRPT